MKKYLYCFLLAALTASTLSCRNSRKQHPANVSSASQTEVSQQTDKAQFPFPKIPGTLTDPESRRSFLLEHYWDEFDFSDTVLLDNRDITEQGFVNHIALLADKQTNPDEIAPSIGNLCKRMNTVPHAREVFTNLFDDYLYDPNSPFYNETLYMTYLQQMIDNPETDRAMKSSFKFKLELIGRNRPGQHASDFTYYLPTGKTCTLNKTEVCNDRLLLVFYDPECPSCHDVMQNMLNDAALQEASESGKLTVLAIYTEGNPEAWRKSLPDMPAAWITGTDREIIKLRALYDLKAMPSLYLLDGKKNVLLKDAPYERIRKELGL